MWLPICAGVAVLLIGVLRILIRRSAQLNQRDRDEYDAEERGRAWIDRERGRALHPEPAPDAEPPSRYERYVDGES